MVGGISTSLGIGTMQITGGLEYLFGIKSGLAVMTIIIVIMAAMYTFVATTGIHKGIKHLGMFNMYLYFALLFFVLFAGPTRGIIENTLTSAGDYISNFIPLTTNLDPIKQTGWHEGWTIFYWAWWISATPLTGLFMIKLARGRTVRQFVLVNMIAPASFVLIWFGVFGSAGIFSDLFDGSGIGATIAKYGSNIAMFELLRQYPAATFMSVLTFVLILISFNTQAEAVAYTLSSMTTVGFDESGDEKDPPKFTTVFWGGLLGLVTIILLYTGGEESMKALQTSVVVCGLPIIFLLVLMAFSYVKCMRHCKEYDIVGTFDDPRYKDIAADQENSVMPAAKPHRV
jgi:glycine betaine transporter